MASTGNPVSGPTKSYIPDAAIGQGLCVQFSGSAVGHIVQTSTANAPAIGIADFPGVAGQALRVTRAGDAQAVAGGSFAAGQLLKTDPQGRLVGVAGAAGENVVGRAESPALAAGDLFIVFLMPSVI